MQAFSDLRSWLQGVEQMGLLKEVRGADGNLELGTITDLNAKRKKYTLLFSEIKNYPKRNRLLTGALADARRVAHSFGFPDSSNIELVAKFRESLKNVGKDINLFPPEYVTSSPVMENTQNGTAVNVLEFPAPKWHEHDGGNYIGTADCVITADPDTEWINIGTYRLMVHNRNELGIHIDTGHHGRFQMNKYFERGEKCPVVVSLGQHPLLFAVSGLEVPFGVSEYNYAGALTRNRWKVIKGPITGLPIPADCEVALEGHILPELRDEGPFGEFMGYYAGGVFHNPVMKVEGIYYRDDPIILGTAPGVPPYDYSYYRCPIRAAMIWDILEKAGIPNVKGVWCHEEGYSRALNVVAIKQAYAGHARQVAHVAGQAGPGAFAGRYVVVVDDDIDPTNLNEVVWAICSRTDPATSIEFIREAWGTALDPMVERTPDMRIDECMSSRGLIYACWPYSRLVRGKIARVVKSSPEISSKYEEKWKDLLS